MTALVLVETVLLTVLTVLVAGLLRAYGTVLRRLHRLDGGGEARDGGREFGLLPVVDRPAEPSTRPAPEFGAAHDIAGETLAGEVVSARVVEVDHDTLLLFLSSGCASCATFWDELARPGSIYLPPRTRLLVVAQSAADESRADLEAMAPAGADGIDVILSSDAWRNYGVPGSPHVVYVDGATGRIRGEGSGQSLRQVAELLARSTGNAAFATPADRPAGSVVTGNTLRKPARDAATEAEVDRELLAAGIVPGDPRLYGADGHDHD